MKVMDHLDALLFDCDGVIAETERDVHRLSFNQAFKNQGLTNEWDVELYGDLLKIGGGKERMTSYFDKVGWPTKITEADRKSFIQGLHNFKTDQFRAIVESGIVFPRPGVLRLIDEAIKSNVKVGVCSTSNELAVTTIVNKLLGPERAAKMKIFAGDMVEKKKPSPDIYLLGAKTLGVDPARCWVIEDSHIGLTAAKKAGMKCCVTVSIYTKDENFEEADLIVKDLDNGVDGPVTMTYLNCKQFLSTMNTLVFLIIIDLCCNLDKNSPRAFKQQTSTENAELFAARTDVNTLFKKMASGESIMGKGMPF